MANLGLRPCARELGISHVRLLALWKEGRVPRNADGSFDLVAVSAAFEKSMDPSQASKIHPVRSEAVTPEISRIGLPQQDDDPGFNKIRTALHAVKLKEARLDLAEREQTLVPVEIIKRHVGNLVVSAKMRLLAMGNKLAPQLASETDPVVCQALIDAEVHEALAEISQWRPAAA